MVHAAKPVGSANTRANTSMSVLIIGSSPMSVT
jgi:hypothetical protein